MDLTPHCLDYYLIRYHCRPVCIRDRVCLLCVVRFCGTVMCYPGRRQKILCVYTNYLTRDKPPASSETISYLPQALKATKHAKRRRTPSSSQGPREKVSLVKFGEYDGEAGLRIKEYYHRGRSVTAGRTAGATRPGAGATRRTIHQSRR